MKKISDRNIKILKGKMTDAQKKELALLKNIYDKKTGGGKKINENIVSSESNPSNLSFSNLLMSYFDKEDMQNAYLAISNLNDGPENTGDEVFGECILILKNAFQKINDLLYTRDDGEGENVSETKH